MKNNKPYLVIITSALLISLSGGVYAGGDAAAGKEKAAQCTSCHGANGEGGSAPNTAIAGMDVGTFTKGILAYKTGERKNPMMEMFAKKLSDQDIADLAAYYSAAK
jgi:cytochrome c553